MIRCSFLKIRTQKFHEIRYLNQKYQKIDHKINVNHSNITKLHDHDYVQIRIQYHLDCPDQ